MNTLGNIEAWAVYGNLLKMVVCRGASLTSPELSQKEVMARLTQSGVVKITGERKNVPGRRDTDLIIVLLSETSRFINDASTFRRLYTDVSFAHNLELIVVASSSLTSGMHKEIAELENTHRPKLRGEIHTYDIFLIDITKHINSGSHRFITEQELREKLKLTRTPLSNLPFILQNDPQAVWLGLYPGDYVEITYPSDNSGTGVMYRKCIPGTLRAK